MTESVKNIGPTWVKPLSTNHTKWSNTLNNTPDFADEMLECVYFVGLALKGLTTRILRNTGSLQIPENLKNLGNFINSGKTWKIQETLDVFPRLRENREI